jgi:Na+-driven multidrug efflux pump
MESDGKAYVVAIICQNLIGLAGAIIFAFSYKLGISGLLYGYAIGLVCMSIVNFLIYIRTSWNKVEKNQFKKW